MLVGRLKMFHPYHWLHFELTYYYWLILIIFHLTSNLTSSSSLSSHNNHHNHHHVSSLIQSISSSTSSSTKPLPSPQPMYNVTSLPFSIPSSSETFSSYHHNHHRSHLTRSISSNYKSSSVQNGNNNANDNPMDSSFNYFSTESSVTNSDESDPGDNYIGDVPEFVDAISNITVPIGREARLTCIVRNLGVFKVAWMRIEDQTILTIHDHIITRNYRIGLTHSELRVWNLIINDAQEEDRGGYMCQINTVPMLYQIGFLDVVVPPRILTSETSVDVIRRENLNASLECKARGYPPPRITWRREDGKPIEYGNWQEKKDSGVTPSEEFDGEKLTINKVSRLHMGAYLCIATNGVQPSVSHRIILNVHFPPMIWVPNQLITASLGNDAVLICNTEASPKSINYWTKDDEDALLNNDKYEISTNEKMYKTQMILTIRGITSKDFGTFKCYARNSLGSTEGSIKLYGIHGSGGKGARQNPTNAKSRVNFNDGSNGGNDANSSSKIHSKQSKTMSSISILIMVTIIVNILL